MKKFLFLLCFIFFFCQLKSQITKGIDTIELARFIAYDKKFDEADRLLSQYSLHNTDVNALRLHAQVLYWMKAVDRASQVYEKALIAFPEQHAIKLDYGRMLFATGKFQLAETLLTQYLLTDNKNVEANILLANINYWKGNIKTAKQQLAIVTNIYPDNVRALALLREINLATAPYVRLGAAFASDDQPLNKSGFEAEAGWLHSWIFAPTLLINVNNFTIPDSIGNYNSLWLQAGNKINFKLSGLILNVRAGIFNHQTNKNESFFTGSAMLSQKISKMFSLEFGMERRPYQFTATSARIPVMQNYSVAALNLNKNNQWLGKASYQLEKFDDNNKVQTAYLWLLAPIISNKTFSLKAGYGFNHSDANVNTYRSKKSISSVIQTTAVGGSIEGYYDPYFTPNNQTIHSILSSVGVKISDKINFTTRANIAVAASADNPALNLQKSQTNNFTISKTYSKLSYTPFDIYNELLLNLSDKFSIVGSYQYSSFLFYKINFGAIQLKYRFINERK